MSNDLMTLFGTLPVNRSALSEALSGLARARVQSGGKALLRLTKDKGIWVFGQDSEKLQEDILVVNPASFATGYVAWNAGQIEGEVMQPLQRGPVDIATLPEVRAKNGWQSQVSFDLTTQDEPHLQLIYKTNNRGGTNATLSLAGEIAWGMEENADRAYPLVQLSTGSYVHREYGLIHTPKFFIVGWLDEEGQVLKERPALV